MEKRSDERFKLLRQIAAAGANGQEVERLFEEVLAITTEFVGLSAAALLLFNDDFTPAHSSMQAKSESDRKFLMTLESDLFAQLRKDHHLASAYLSFSYTPPKHTFTLPLTYAGKVFGAVIGLHEGNRQDMIQEDDFLETFSSMMALCVAASKSVTIQGASDDAIDRERLAAILETAVTLNHEINNPLTAILGNIQLLLLKRDDLDDELRNKLKTIEQSATRIQNVISRLLRLDSAKTVSYNGDIQMLDLGDEED
jgi:K+-sensing histidine kinase KdpD